jgi:hypothetical protein
MSKFDKAAAKAASSAPKAKAKAEPAPVSATPAKPAAVLKTLEEKKKFVVKHEVKMEDLQDDIKNEPNSKKKKGN